MKPLIYTLLSAIMNGEDKLSQLSIDIGYYGWK